ncbi:Etoposide-induced 2.4 [Phytophthora cactorum]|nr:Etoposide-induced 2.4 [Phytophthora cactorum]
MSDAFSAGFREFCGGVQHAVSLHRILLFYLKSRLICVSSVKCFVLNGLIFLGSIYFFDQAVIPVIHMFGELLHRSFSYGMTTQVDDVRDRVDGFVFFLYQVLWMYPIYCISFILNTIWYQEIADDAYMQLHGKPSPTPVTDMIRDEMYRAILVAFFLLQTVLSYLIPFHSPELAVFALLLRVQVVSGGWSLERRLAHLEQNWAYFAGFGSPFTLATFFVPNFVSKGIFALLFPVKIEQTMPEAYTVSKMLSSINEVMAPVATDVCRSVTLQRRTDNGIMLNTSEKEIAYLDTKARVKHSAQQAAQLDKLSTPTAREGETKLNNFDDARADVSRAKQIVRGPSTSLDGANDQLVDRLDKQLEDISRAELRHKHRVQQQKQFQKKMMQEAVGKLYKDKKEVDCAQHSDDTNDALKQHHESFLTFAEAALSCNGWNAGVGWILAMLAMVINAVSRFLVATRGKVKMS